MKRKSRTLGAAVNNQQSTIDRDVAHTVAEV